MNMKKEKKINIFLSGPMTGLPEFNHPAFNAAAKKLRANGHVVWNPAEIRNGDTSQTEQFYMRVNLYELTKPSGTPGAGTYYDAVVRLPHWMLSNNSKLEILVGMALGLEIHDEKTFGTIKDNKNG